MDENDFDFFDLEEATSIVMANGILVSSESKMQLSEIIKSEAEETEIIPQCNEHFDLEGDLLERTNSVHDKFVSCDLCSEKFVNKKVLRQHRKKQHYPGLKKLVGSTKHSSSSKDVNVDPKTAACVKVKKEVLEDTATNTTESVLCTECGKQFVSKQKLAAHVAIVHNVEEVACHICGNVFKHKYYLRAHINYVHVSTNLDNHINWLMCDICCKSFKNAANLFSHKKHVHEYEHGLFCSICSASAKNKYALRKHVRKCIKKDPSKRKLPKENLNFPCDKCTSTFGSDENLKLHQKYVHEIIPMQCQLCFRRFKNYTHVRQHLRRVHCQETTPDLYIFLNKDTFKEEFLPFKEDSKSSLYIRQAKLHSPETTFDCQDENIEDDKILSEELNEINNLVGTLEHI